MTKTFLFILIYLFTACSNKQENIVYLEKDNVRLSEQLDYYCSAKQAFYNKQACEYFHSKMLERCNNGYPDGCLMLGEIYSRNRP